MNFDAPSGKAGRARQIEIAQENTAAIQLWTGLMIEGLGRPASVAEQITAESIATCFILARRCRDKGDRKGDVELLREAALLMRDSVFRDPHAAPSPMAAPQ
jgi:hypothetical protein